MSVRRSLATLIAALVLGTSCQQTTSSSPPPQSTPPPQPSATLAQPLVCQEAVSLCSATSPSQCAKAPLTTQPNYTVAEPCIPQGEASQTSQNLIDVSSWNAFIALNWPAVVSSCTADTTKSILNVKGGDGSFVAWQTYMPSENVFVNPGYQTPAAWCSGNSLAQGARRVFRNEAKADPHAKLLGGAFLKIAEPGGDVLQASGDVVTDQNKRWLRYERLMNQTEYNYISNGLWNAPLLQAYANASQRIQIPAGSLELKSAWKVLTPTEISSKRYFTTQALVCNTPDGQQTACDVNPVTMGLVGLHIVQQTNSGGTMFWATFEQVDNDSVFFNPQSNAAVNTDFAQQPFTELDSSCNGINLPTQIKRVNAVQASNDINTYYQGLLSGSVFANYRLISTQWTTGVGVTALGTPPNVANVTLETYVQSNVASSGATGCMSCHLAATTNIKTASGYQDANHSFLFLEAQYATMPPRH